MKSNNRKSGRRKWLVTGCIAMISGLYISSLLEAQDTTTDTTIRFIEQVKMYDAALNKFQYKYGALPGDYPDADTMLPRCVGGGEESPCKPLSSSAGDGVIGNKDFIQGLATPISTTSVPASSAADETVLFWQHLGKADLIAFGDNDLKSNQELSWGVTHPEALVGGGLTVGFAFGEPLPKHLSPASTGMAGVLLVLTTSPKGDVDLTAAGQQVLTPHNSARVDRKLDDGNPSSGFVQAYGSPYCFYAASVVNQRLGKPDTWTNSKIAEFYKERVSKDQKAVKYSEEYTGKECGLVMRLWHAP